MPAYSGHDRVPLLDQNPDEIEKGKFWQEIDGDMDGNANRVYDGDMVSCNKIITFLTKINYRVK